MPCAAWRRVQLVAVCSQGVTRGWAAWVIGSASVSARVAMARVAMARVAVAVARVAMARVVPHKSRREAVRKAVAAAPKCTITA